MFLQIPYSECFKASWYKLSLADYKPISELRGSPSFQLHPAKPVLKQDQLSYVAGVFMLTAT